MSTKRRCSSQHPQFQLTPLSPFLWSRRNRRRRTRRQPLALDSGGPGVCSESVPTPYTYGVLQNGAYSDRGHSVAWRPQSRSRDTSICRALSLACGKPERSVLPFSFSYATAAAKPRPQLKLPKTSLSLLAYHKYSCPNLVSFLSFFAFSHRPHIFLTPAPRPLRPPRQLCRPDCRYVDVWEVGTRYL